MRRSALDAAAKSELRTSTDGFTAEQLGNSTANDPTRSPYLYRETPNNVIKYAYGNTQTYCMQVQSKGDSSVVLHQFAGNDPSQIDSGACPTPDYRTAYRCISGGGPANIGSTYTLTNTTMQPVSLRLNHSSTGEDEDISSIAPGATKFGVTNLRTGSVARGVISFRVYSVTPAALLETYYQASPALSC